MRLQGAALAVLIVAAVIPSSAAAAPPTATMPEVEVLVRSCLACDLSLFAQACAPAPGDMSLVFKGWAISPLSEPLTWTVPLVATGDPGCAYGAAFSREGPMQDSNGFDIYCGVLVGVIAGDADASEGCFAP